MEINQKRQPDTQPARDALSSAPEARHRRPSGLDRQLTLQRWALGGIGAVGLGALLTLAGCPANLEDPQRFADGGAITTGPGAIPTCLQTLFSGTGKCSGNVCHSAGAMPAGGLDLTSPNVAARLINVPATHGDIDFDGGGVTCPMAKLIDTSNPSASWLLIKINGTQGTCGSAMPQVGTLTSAEKTCIQNYVTTVSADAGTTMSGGSGGAATAGGSAGATTTGGAATGGSAGASTNGGSGGASGSGASGASAGGSGGRSGGASAGSGGT